jgi:transposase InsO family protein
MCDMAGTAAAPAVRCRKLLRGSFIAGPPSPIHSITSSARASRLMGLARSTYYDEPESQRMGEARLVEQIKIVCAEWPAYGYRRVTAELQGEGRVVNHKKVMRLMKENRLTVRPRRRFIATNDRLIFPNLAKNIVPTNLNQLWVADITCIAITTGFVYLTAILDAWSRRVVGYAIGRRIDARLALAALRAAIAARRPPTGASITPTAVRSTLPKTTAPSSPSTASTVRWVDAATHTTTPRPRAS